MTKGPAIEELELAFPRAGARARNWMRFERDYLVWLGASEGRFAIWCAQRQLSGALRPEREDRIGHLSPAPVAAAARTRAR